MNDSYFNTTHLIGKELAESIIQAKTQDEKILAFFKGCPGKKCSPYFVQMAVLQRAPITSIRRSMTTLTAAGHLVKTDHMVMGPYNKPSHTWKLAEKEPLQPALF